MINGTSSGSVFPEDQTNYCWWQLPSLQKTLYIEVVHCTGPYYSWIETWSSPLGFDYLDG